MPIVFPDIRKALYSASSLSEATVLYIDQLRACSDNRLFMLQYANKLEKANNVIASENFKTFDNPSIPEGNSFIDQLCKFLYTWSISNNVYLRLTWRIKSLISYNEKIRKFILIRKPLCKILDLIGLRIIVGQKKKDSIETIELCYKLSSDLEIFFSESLHTCFLDSESRNSEENVVFEDDVDVENIVISKEHGIPIESANNWKDYIRYPKSNGYQGLHFVQSLQSGIEMELQIRTFAMDDRAENGSCRHSKHKDKRYPQKYEDLTVIDHSKVHIPKFWIDQYEEYIFDPENY